MIVIFVYNGDDFVYLEMVMGDFGIYCGYNVDFDT